MGVPRQHRRGWDILPSTCRAGASGARLDGWLPFDRIGDGVGFDANGVAYDLDTGAVKFSPALAGTFLTSLAGGGVAVTDGVTLTELDDTGAVVRESPMPVIPAPLAARMMLFEGAGTTPSYGGAALWTTIDSDGVAAIEGPDLVNHPLEFPDVNFAAQPSTVAFPYLTKEGAAIAALTRFHKDSVKEYTEYGGQICELTSAGVSPRFAYGSANRGLPCQYFSPCSVDPDRFACPSTLVPGESTRSVAEYHTHPDSEAVSGEDRSHSAYHFTHDSLALVGYVSTSCGWVRTFGFNPAGVWYNEKLNYPPGHLVMLFQPTPPCSSTEASVWSSVFDDYATVSGRRQ